MHCQLVVIVSVDHNMELYRPTTDFAVFDILLIGDRTIDNNAEMFAAVGAHDGVIFQRVQHKQSSPQQKQ
jgi:hypothetical protein